MEVHHHPHAEKKNFKEYFLEFLMIFLAVTMGFFAESLREHFVDVRITNEYLQSYKQELEHNKNTLHRDDSIFSDQISADDSISMLFYNKKENKDLITTGRLFSNARRISQIILDDAAYQQLINSGGLRYIHNTALKDSMAHYSYEIQVLVNYNQIKYEDRSAGMPEMNSLDDIHDWTSLTKILKIDPYPELTERERRFIVSFYRQNYIQFKADKRLLLTLHDINEHLLNVVQTELNK